MMRASRVAESTARAVVAAVGRLRREPLTKPPGVAEAVDWAEAATLLAQGGARLAGGVQALDRGRAQGRGGSRLHGAASRRDDRGDRRMSDPATLPRAAASPSSPSRRCCGSNGFLVAPEQTAAFLAAIELLGPSGITDIRRAGHATLGPAARAARGIRRPVRCAFSRQDDDGRQRPRRARTTRSASARAIAAASSHRSRTRAGNPGRPRRPPKCWPRAASVPRAKPRSCAGSSAPCPSGCRDGAAIADTVDRRGRAFDLRRSLREAIRNDGEVMRLPRLRRRTRQRRVLLLIDVSGSMKERTEAHLRFAHALARAVERIEMFTIGTRLTRVSQGAAG